MTFLFPGFLIAAGAVSMGVVVLHFLITQQPKSEDLPTVRFVPDVPARSTSLAIKPSDLWLLLLRVIAIMLIGAAFAQPILTPQHQTVARIVVVDASRGVGSMAELADSAAKYANGAAALIIADSLAYEVPSASFNDSISALSTKPASIRKGSLSPALITAMRAGARVREQADSIELVVISPFVNESRDAALSPVRALWPGTISNVKVAAASSADASAVPAEVVWVSSDNSPLWSARETPDTVGAVRADDVVLVAPFVRNFKPTETLDSTTRVFARWPDGEPAGLETVTASGCIRTLGLTMPSGGDVALRPDFIRLQAKINEPCGVFKDFTSISDETMSEIAGSGGLASIDDIQPKASKMTPLVPWLLAAALLLVLFELFVRRRIEQGAQQKEEALAIQDNAKEKAA